MTLCAVVSIARRMHKLEHTYHFQCPDSPYPYLQLALNASDVVKLDTLPPATASWFSPKEKQLLRHSDSVTVSKIVALDIGPQTRKCDAADDSLVRFAGAVAPSIVMVEAAEHC
jgi:hypothetical protein